MKNKKLGEELTDTAWWIAILTICITLISFALMGIAKLIGALL
jgi:hypothetical protein